jgi:hypothetical protein
MSRNLVSVFLSILFLAFIAGPTVVVMIDDSIDISIYYASSSSEEEENGAPKIKEVNILVSESDISETDIFSNDDENHLEYYFKNYPKPHLNLISPPPDFHII